MDFVAIDFETATSSRNSPCEIGLTFVENNQVAETKSWLIKPECYPYFDSFNTMIHGITPDDVKNTPKFSEIWQDILPLIENKFLVAHNASFDLSVLRATLELYQLPFPALTYGCTYALSRAIWTGLPMYRLDYLCEIHHIPLIHHRAGADSRATAELALKIFSEKSITSYREFPKKVNINYGCLYPGGYKPCNKVPAISANRKTQKYGVSKNNH